MEAGGGGCQTLPPPTWLLIIKGTDIDKSAILEQELHKLAHRYTIDMLNIIQTHLPDILEGIAAGLRQKADKKRKEELLNAKKN